MKNYVLLVSFLCLTLIGFSQQKKYKSLDLKNPIEFKGDYIIYQQDTIFLSPTSFFIDGQLTDEQAKKYPFVYNSINKAVKYLKKGTETNPMVLHIAPYVYWIDNPDDPKIRVPKTGSIPFGLEIQCDWLTFNGLTKNAKNVVLACNRGQTIGAKGNFTMLHIDGEGTSSKNITFGNYCNVDLVYPLKPSLNKKKRATAIVQAQLIICNGDKITATNTRFISRLNLCPFVGGKRVFFNQCHFESTDDALCGTAVYKDCTFTFFSSKPFYQTIGTGVVFLNCDITSYTNQTQYFTKANGQVALIDTRIVGEKLQNIAWRDVANIPIKNYQHRVTLNGKRVLVNQINPENTIDINDERLLNTYKFSYQGKTIYNTYNLLKGKDGWDPEGIKPLVMKAEKAKKQLLTNLPVQLITLPNKKTIETNKDSIILKASLYKFGNVLVKNPDEITWSVSASDENFVQLIPGKKGHSCVVIPTNDTNFSKKIIISSKTKTGLEAASVIIVKPSKLKAPIFYKKPTINQMGNESLKVHYTFKDFKFKDESIITWYKSKDKKGTHKIKIGVSRLNNPMVQYSLSYADIGYYISVTIAPKHQRSDAGEEYITFFNNKINTTDVKTNPNIFETDFKNIPVENQTEIIPGTWTFTPLKSDKEVNRKKEGWIYAEGSQGSSSKFGLLQNGRAASMNYTPVNNNIKDIKLSLIVSPYKTAGQGFSVAPLYMDVVINFDPKTKTGYGLRFIRTTKYGNAVDCYFVKYHQNKTTAISEPVSTSCFRSPCEITLSLKGYTLSASATTKASYNEDNYPNEVIPKAAIQTTIEPFHFTSFGIEYHGGSTTMIDYFKAEANNINLK
ncbi:hypothetical protein QVZ41_10145 [Wenyingzhuangia sp. chi5]|uniref:Pectinesterase catalytic domain-containing protein n=1 Tax=Wenyingzhuangia gilva TaxID=3057677 RepID=A0ABT8VTA1_9FLAO|nr:hypothetical protein [Wenyingzhuangia sp. chi5]MDO3695205.1 hypothetical protein [Wenyingzhuangia sp. chi5]